MQFEFLDTINTDLWTYLKSANKRIVVYGTGNGADKIIDVLDDKEIELSGIFASDDFARDRTFRGFKVKKYRDFCEEFEDFIVLVSFATQRDEVLENIYRIANERELYAPDVPVFGEGLFDYSYFKENYYKFLRVYNRLSDDISRRTFVSTIAFKLTGKINYLKDCESTESDETTLLRSNIYNKNYVDIGAYTGDTIEKYCSVFGKNEELIAFEPDKKNFSKMLARFEKEQITCNCLNYVAWDKNEILKFYSNSGRAGSADRNRSSDKYTEMQAVKPDDYINIPVGYVKIDAEGSDVKALCGLTETIKKYKPFIKVAAYHRNEDYFAIPQTIDMINPNYKLYMRHMKYIPGWDTDFFFEFVTD